ncbi:MAG: sodium:solute symporter, partial [Planctomycetota bacterium]
GQVLAALFVASVFVPVFYANRVATVYQLLEQRIGTGAKQAASAAFMLGRVLASGARLYIAAIAAALVMFGDLEPLHLCLGVALLTLISIAYSLAGGLTSIIWTDVVQTVVFVGAAVAALVVLWHRIPLPWHDLVAVLEHPSPGAPSKLGLFQFGLDPSAAYTLPTAVFGFALLNAAAYATDQDLAQRMLTCRSAIKGSWSMIGAIAITIPVTLLFLFIGLLLFVIYQRADVMGAAAPTHAADDGREVFLTFIMREMPGGLAGIMLAGLFAVGFTSLLSALNAMASAFVNDFYRRLRPAADDAHYLKVGRLAVVGWGVVLGGFAIACVFWQRAQGQALIDFALGVMTFAYSGLLAVFCTAVFTRRGTSASAVAALVAGAVAVTLLQNAVWPVWAPDAWCAVHLAFPWHMLIASLVAFGVCCLGRREQPRSQVRPQTMTLVTDD